MRSQGRCPQGMRPDTARDRFALRQRDAAPRGFARHLAAAPVDGLRTGAVVPIEDSCLKEIEVSCISAHDPQLERLADAIAQRVGPQRFHVWFNNSTRLDLRNDGLEIAVPNDFISEWIGKNFKQPIQDAANEVLGCTLPVKFLVVPQLFEVDGGGNNGNGNGNG